MLWIKSLHIIFMVSWMAAMLYLPRLFVYHAQAADPVGIERFKLMQRKLFFGIMTPAAVLTLVSGVWLWLGYGFAGGWLTAKLGCVGLLLVYHGWCFRVLLAFKHDRNRRSHRFYRWMNELPAVLLAVTVILVVVKPF